MEHARCSVKVIWSRRPIIRANELMCSGLYPCFSSNGTILDFIETFGDEKNPKVEKVDLIVDKLVFLIDKLNEVPYPGGNK